MPVTSSAMTSGFITSVGSGLTSAIGWFGDVIESFGSSGALADLLPVVGILCGLGVFSWGLNKIIGLFRNIG